MTSARMLEESDCTSRTMKHSKRRMPWFANAQLKLLADDGDTWSAARITMRAPGVS
jgi:hypothetical protein